VSVVSCYFVVLFVVMEVIFNLSNIVSTPRISCVWPAIRGPMSSQAAHYFSPTSDSVLDIQLLSVTGNGVMILFIRVNFSCGQALCYHLFVKTNLVCFFGFNG
jgi:hypothetical protein